MVFWKVPHLFTQLKKKIKNMKKILTIFGTRPEIIKLAPVIKELKRHRNKFITIIGTTAQHRSMLDQILKLFDIVPDIDLNLMKQNQSLADFTSLAMNQLDIIMKKVKPDIVLIQGDTTTALVASVIAFYHKKILVHVEAGLRTYNKYEPFPEEINRKIISTIADIHFTPGNIAKKNLLSEGISEQNIYVTGNTVIDALIEIKNRFKTKIPKFPNELLHKIKKKRLILVTGHRRENFDKGVKELCFALKEIIQKHNDVCIIYPVHLNPNVYTPVHQILKGIDRIYLIDPLPYDAFIYLMNLSFIILSDSGGVQEEAPFFGKPVLVTRNVTERPEAVTEGNSKIIGMRRDSIIKAINELLDDPKQYKKMAVIRNIYGDGKASQRIVKALMEYEKRT